MGRPENSFISSVHGHLPSFLYWMKNHNEYTAGVWDCWYSGINKDLWIEYKFNALPARPDTIMKPDLSGLQLEWGRERSLEGRNCWVIMGSKPGGVILEPTEWGVGITCGEFLKRVKSRTQLADTIFDYVNGV